MGCISNLTIAGKPLALFFGIVLSISKEKNEKYLLYVLNLINSRNRVAVQLQKNLDRVRLRRVAHKLSQAQAAKAAEGSRTGGNILICLSDIDFQLT